MSADDANAIIMVARVAAGWIEAPVEKVEEAVAAEEPAEEPAE